MCLVFSIIECVCWCLRVTWSSMFVDESSYVSFPRPSIFCIHFVVYFESETNYFLLGALCHCHFHQYIHWQCDFTSCWIWADHHSSSCSLLHHHSRFCFWFIHFISPIVIFLQWPNSRFVTFFYTSHYQFVFLHCLIIVIIFTLGTLGSMAYEIFYTCCNLIPRAWVFYH